MREIHTLGFINIKLEGNFKIPADFLGSGYFSFSWLDTRRKKQKESQGLEIVLV